MADTQSMQIPACDSARFSESLRELLIHHCDHHLHVCTTHGAYYQSETSFPAVVAPNENPTICEGHVQVCVLKEANLAAFIRPVRFSDIH